MSGIIGALGVGMLAGMGLGWVARGWTGRAPVGTEWGAWRRWSKWRAKRLFRRGMA